MSIPRSSVPGQRRPSEETAAREQRSGELTQELLHDSKQSIATILALVAAGRNEITDRDRLLTRLDQVASQAKELSSLLDEAMAPGATRASETPAPLTEAVDVSSLASTTLNELTAGYGGTVRLMTGAGARAEISRTSFRRVLTNLVRNAMRAAGPTGNVEVSVVARADQVVLDVEDDGPGFGSLPVVNGIGLRSSRRLVRRHGGRLGVSTGRLGGARVRVDLPADACPRGRPR